MTKESKTKLSPNGKRLGAQVLAHFILCGMALLWVATAQAQTWWGLESRSYYDPPLAEIHGAQTQVLFPMRTDAFQYSVHPGRRYGWNIDLGTEIPIFGFDGGAPQVNGAAPGKWGIGLWFPLSFHMIEDLGTDPSSPILDTDYRFSGMVKVQRGLPLKWGPFRESHAGFRFQFGHESTHVGDEFTINATGLFGNQFKRVNVSYEYWDLGASFEPNWGPQSRHHLKLRGGNIGLFNPGKGWYTPQLEHPFGAVIAGSKRNIEPYGDVEYYFERAENCKHLGCLGPVISIDFRDRTIYNYEKLTQSQPEDTELSTNIVLGVRQKRAKVIKFTKFQPVYYARYYHGVNPFGQFRNQRGYTLFGLGVNFGF